MLGRVCSRRLASLLPRRRLTHCAARELRTRKPTAATRAPAAWHSTSAASAQTMAAADEPLELPPVSAEAPSPARKLDARTISARVQERVRERNAWASWTDHTPGEVISFLWKNMRLPPSVPPPAELDQTLPVLPLDFARLRQPPPPGEIRATWIGHASLLVQMGGINILTDPHFSERAAPVQFAGPKRFRPPATTPAALAAAGLEIHAALLSHNHYDHLDYSSMLAVASAFPRCQHFVPLGLRAWYEKNLTAAVRKSSGDGRAEPLVTEMDWHERAVLAVGGEQLEVVFVPMQHWSSRSGWDRDAVLWGGFVLESPHARMLFPGDTGYFSGLADLGARYGPFTLAAIPIGAYTPRDFLRVQHIDPDEAVRMMLDLRADAALPIHWGTFVLTLEPVLEPRQRLADALVARGIDPARFPALTIGETRAYRSTGGQAL